MRRSLLALIACTALSLGCSRNATPRVPEPRELGRATVDGVEIRVGIAASVSHIEAGLSRGLGYQRARDLFAVVDEVSATKDGARFPLYDVGTIDHAFAGDAPRNARELASKMRSLDADACGVDHGLVYRLGTRWEVVWVAGNRAFRVPIDGASGSCGEIASRLPARDVALARNPGGATACLALAEANAREAALECYLTGVEHDLLTSVSAPRPGVVMARTMTHRDRDAMERRIVADAALRESFEARLVDSPPPYTTIDQVVPLVRTLDAASRREPFVRRVIDACRDPNRACAMPTLWVAAVALQDRPNACALVSELVAAVRSRPDPDANVRAFRAARGAFRCDSPELRALYLAGLVITTTPDTRLPSPDYAAYASIDPDCQEAEGGARPEVLPLCNTLSRFAGTWLAGHCTSEAVARATGLARSRPRTPFDPREDQLLDGALRVLGRCDASAFEAAIEHVPESVVAAADLRSKEHLRAVFLHVAPTTP